MATNETTTKIAPSNKRTSAEADASKNQKDARQHDRRSPAKGGKTTVKRAAPESKNGTTRNDASATTSNVKLLHKSALDAAATILDDASTPMSCGEMIGAILKRKPWSTKGKTPAATLSSAILREIQRKGKDSRFAKAERVRFQRSKSA